MVTLFLCGDVMIGRGIDQVLQQSVDPQLFEPYVKSAEGYVTLATDANGPIPRPVAPEYVWGEALQEIDRRAPAVRIVNLETTLTTSDAASIGKDVLYRAHPRNVEVLRAGGIDCCSLANNHLLDWGEGGLLETLSVLQEARIVTVGAGPDRVSALQPAILEVPGGRVIVLGIASTNSGVPSGWAAAEGPGVAMVDGWSLRAAQQIADHLQPIRRPGDVVVASVHWGSNWGYRIPDDQRRLAHALVDVGGVDVVHGHSSHHPRGIEIHQGRPILYACGDFINDYEGITGYEGFRDELVLAYFPTLDPLSGRMLSFTISPFQLRRFRLARASAADAAWLRDTLDRHSRPLGTRVELEPDGSLSVHAAAG